MISKMFNEVDNAKALLVFAHGAGAGMSHPFMEEFSVLLNKAGLSVLRFNFPYMDKRAETGKRYPPNRITQLLDCYCDVVEQISAEENYHNLPVFIGGKSMGSRVAAMLTANDSPLSRLSFNKVRGVFCIGYPFHPDKKPQTLRLEPLRQNTKPVLILQGERDPLGSQLEIVNYELPALCQCQYFTDADHNLKPRVKSGFTQQQHLHKAVKAIEQFILENCSNG